MYRFLFVSLFAVAAAHAAQGQPYPAKPLRMVVGFAPGGAPDILARLLTQPLHDALGQPVIVDNRPGATSNIGAEIVARALPDGYTLFMATVSLAISPSVYPALAFKVPQDFTPVSMVASVPLILVVHPGLPVANLTELIAYAKARPGQLAFASSGAGGSPHLAGEMLKQLAGIDLIHVPYKGAAPALADVLSGTVAIGFKTALSAIPHM